MTKSTNNAIDQRASHHQLQLRYCAVDALKPFPRNPRLHSGKQVKQISASIKAFGFAAPILVDADRNVIAGHGRLLAAKLLGLSQVPTISLEHLNSDQAKAYRIADNRLTDTSIWDDRLLAETLNELSEVNLDFSIEAIGFTTGEIDCRIEGLEISTRAGPDPADKLPVAGPLICRTGDFWLLGKHRVLCGDATKAASHQTLMGGEKASVIATDPPYNECIPGHVSGLGAVAHQNFAMAAGEMTANEFTNFLTTVFSLMAAVCCDGALAYIFMDWRHQLEILKAGLQTFSKLMNLCVWAKNNAGMGSLYRSQHELVYVFKHGRGPHRNNVELGKHGRHRSNVWNYPNVTSFGRSGEEGNLLALHPTVKPVRLLADAILDCTMRGDIVLDPFLGSGSTLLAAERTGRRCFGIEIDPTYCDVIIRRWQAWTRQDAVCATTLRTFDDIASERGAGVKSPAVPKADDGGAD